MISEDLIVSSATYLGVEPCALKAVIAVETNGKAFLADGRPVILFEGHVFWKALKDLGMDPHYLSATNPDIIYPTWTKKYYIGGPGEYTRFERASKINRGAAIAATSWGLFQIMGNNFKLCGCRTIEDFFEKQATIEEHMQCAVEFLKHSGCLPYLKDKNWSQFARKYNGPRYAENQYDTKLRKAYEQCCHG